MNKIANWLREASSSDDVEKIVTRCHVAAGEIERLEIKIADILREHDEFKQHVALLKARNALTVREQILERIKR